MTVKRIAGIAAGILLALAVQAPAHALQHLEGDAARAHIGNPKARFTAGGYTYEILKRTHRDSMNARFSDGVILTNRTNRYYYKERRDSNHIVVLGHPNGREEDPVTADAVVWNPLWNALSDDHPEAHVFLDDEGKEIAVVYVGPRTTLEAKPSDEGLLEIGIRVRSNNPPSNAMGRRR